jgi:hypothetical protein
VTRNQPLLTKPGPKRTTHCRQRDYTRKDGFPICPVVYRPCFQLERTTLTKKRLHIRTFIPMLIAKQQANQTLSAARTQGWSPRARMNARSIHRSDLICALANLRSYLHALLPRFEPFTTWKTSLLSSDCNRGESVEVNSKSCFFFFGSIRCHSCSAAQASGKVC